MLSVLAVLTAAATGPALMGGHAPYDLSPEGAQATATAVAQASASTQIEAPSRPTLTSVDYQVTYDGTVYNKTALVYLPHPDAPLSRDTNFLYLMHGSSQSAQDMASQLQPVLEDMTRKGTLDTVVVFTTYYPDPSLDSDSDDWMLDEPLVTFFTDHELTEALVPAVEARYRFGTTPEQVRTSQLVDTRDHRAFGGFSMGSIMTWDVLEDQLPFFSRFMPVSASSWEVDGYQGAEAAQATAEHISAEAAQVGTTSLDLRIYAVVGEKDIEETQFMDLLVDTLRTSDPELFTSESLTYTVMPGGGHDLGVFTKAFEDNVPGLFD